MIQRLSKFDITVSARSAIILLQIWNYQIIFGKNEMELRFASTHLHY